MKLAATSNLVIDRKSEQCDFINKVLCSQFSTENTNFLGWETNGKIVAVCAYSCFQNKSIEIHIASDGKNWLTRSFLYHAFYYPFEFLKVKVLLGYVDSENERALKFNRHLGFTEECRIKDCGKNGDLIILTMRKENCKFISVGAH